MLKLFLSWLDATCLLFILCHTVYNNQWLIRQFLVLNDTLIWQLVFYIDTVMCSACLKTNERMFLLRYVLNETRVDCRRLFHCSCGESEAHQERTLRWLSKRREGFHRIVCWLCVGMYVARFFNCVDWCCCPSQDVAVHGVGVLLIDLLWPCCVSIRTGMVSVREKSLPLEFLNMLKVESDDVVFNDVFFNLSELGIWRVWYLATLAGPILEAAAIKSWYHNRILWVCY